MIHTRQDRERLEAQSLAPYAARSAESRGRAYPEARHDYRSEFQRDRDRILHSRAFRRLEYKTQVFVNSQVDHYRTRLTHTIEMAAVGRTLARALRANEDLTEAIALAHDIGHSPFGHVGEEALDELMKNEGGFDHNEQSCRWVEILEQPYPEFPGLNLTWEVRAGLRKHAAQVAGAALDGHALGPCQMIEAQIADIADDMTYFAHDIDDGLDAGLLSEEQLRTVDVWRRADERVRAENPGIAEDRRMRATIRRLLDLQVEDVLKHSAALLERHRPDSPGAVMRAPERLVAFSPEMKAMLEAHKSFLFKNMYFNSGVTAGSQAGVRMIRRLFLFYIDHPETMGRKARARIAVDGLWRAACDYLSGMTDRYAIEEYMKFGLNEGDAV